MTINPTASLKWSAILFAVLWTVWMVWWSGSVQPANVIILAICGTLAIARAHSRARDQQQDDACATLRPTPRKD
jgi:hypothetical protein